MFLRSGWARQAGLAFGDFIQNHSDGEERLICNALAGFGQACEYSGEGEEAAKFYQVALQGYQGIGDYKMFIVRRICWPNLPENATTMTKRLASWLTRCNSLSGKPTMQVWA